VEDLNSGRHEPETEKKSSTDTTIFNEHFKKLALFNGKKNQNIKPN